MQISQQQQEIVNKIQYNNVIVDSVAGSGKTTTNIFIAKKHKDKNILLITYNSKLKIETRNKMIEYDIKNMEVHNYHSYCVKYYDNRSYRDKYIKNIIKDNTKSKNKSIYDIIILDEVQDITELYYKLICKIYKDNKNVDCKICILGDVNQTIYTYNGADNRYIKYADKIFNLNKYNFIKCKLNKSFRITNHMAEFINNCMLKENRILSDKISNYKPEYIICDLYGNIPYEILIKYINKGYKPDEIFILAPSVKNINSPIRKLENKIKTENPEIKIYVPNSDGEKIKKDIIEKKLLISTFHQTKGLERKIVMIFGFDSSYFKFYKRNVSKNVCPNELYVASTRGLEHLILFHNYKFNYLDFIDINKIKQHTNFKQYNNIYNFDINIPKTKSVTEICRHLSNDVLSNCIKYISINNIQKKQYKINIPCYIKENKNMESVSDINGTAIPLYYEYIKKKDIKCKIEIMNVIKKRNISDEVDRYIININEKISKILYNIKNNKIDIQQLLYFTNIWLTYKNRYLYKIQQINNYNWLNDNHINSCIDNMKKLNLSENINFEKKLSLNIEHLNILLNSDIPWDINKKNNIHITKILYYMKNNISSINGYIDCIDENNNNIYEFKCVDEIHQQHYIQILLYAFIYEYNIKLKNIHKYELNDIIKYKYKKSYRLGKIIKFHENNKITILNSNTKRNNKINKNDIVHKIIDKNYCNKITNNYFIYNILTNELNQLIFQFGDLINIFIYIIYKKYIYVNNMSDVDFISNITNIKNFDNYNKFNLSNNHDNNIDIYVNNNNGDDNIPVSQLSIDQNYNNDNQHSDSADNQHSDSAAANNNNNIDTHVNNDGDDNIPVSQLSINKKYHNNNNNQQSNSAAADNNIDTDTNSIFTGVNNNNYNDDKNDKSLIDITDIPNNLNNNKINNNKVYTNNEKYPQLVSNIDTSTNNMCEYIYIKGKNKGIKCNKYTNNIYNGVYLCNKHKVNLSSQKYINNIKFMIIDIETTGLNNKNDDIIEIAYKIVKNNNIIMQYTSLIKTDKKINNSIYQLTGINNDMLNKHGNNIRDVLDKLYHDCKDCVFVAHYTQFDFNFISEKLKFYNNSVLDIPQLCTCKMAQILKSSNIINVDNCKLSTLCRYFNIYNQHAHRAMSDVNATYELLKKILSYNHIYIYDYISKNIRNT